MSQNWPLSQQINKSSGTCSVCFATRQVHINGGTIHKHGPRHDPCPGSNRPPLQARSQTQAPADQPVSTASANHATPNDVTGSADSSVYTAVPDHCRRFSAIWSPADNALGPIKHIPKSARGSCASHLSSVLRKVVSNSDSIANWLELFNWSSAVLQPPKRGGRRHNLASVIKRRISSYSSGHIDSDQANPTRFSQDKKSQKSTLGQAISAKLEDGNVRSAIRLLMSDDSPAAPSPESLKALRDKHPRASSNLSDLAAARSEQCVSVDESEVRRAILSFPAGSAGGPDGLRPQHIRDMLMCRDTESEFLSALTAFVNLVLAGRCPSDAAAVFFGGRLLALKKKTGGIRPIAIGFTLRRLASKCANSFGIDRLRPYFYPHQLGVGTPGGCEAAVHSARRYLEVLPQDHVLVKLDFTNAFNRLHRRDMLLSVHSRIPELYAFCLSAYSQPSLLFFGPEIVSSEEGPQQGDPIRPLCSATPFTRCCLLLCRLKIPNALL